MVATTHQRLHHHTAPLRLLLLALVLLVSTAGCGGGEAGEASGTSSAEQFNRLGERVYRNQCATCHQMDGQGVPGIYPPLQTTEWVLGDKGRLIRLALHGLRGPIEVNGQTYDAVMTPQGFLTDEQLAAVLTHVRTHFGNEASPVTTDEVTSVRLGAEREEFWTPEELRGATGIPDVELP